MAYQKLQVSQALAVIPDNSIPIPDPSSKVLVGNADFSVAGVLTDVGTTFLTDGILTNAIIYNTTAQKAFRVTEVTDDLKLAITPSSAQGSSDNYVIYNEATVGCVLFVGVAGDVKAIMAETNGGASWSSASSVMFKGIAGGAFLPIQVIGVASATTATDIVALW